MSDETREDSLFLTEPVAGLCNKLDPGESVRCDRPAGHTTPHHAPGPFVGTDFVWSNAEHSLGPDEAFQ